VKRRKHTYQQRIFIYFFAAFTAFAISILLFQNKREKTYRTAELEARLDQVASITSAYVNHRGLPAMNDYSGLDSLGKLFPVRDLRITLIDAAGTVKYDNFVSDYADMENHLMRPEVQKALYSGKGSNIRHSETTNQDFFYYARYFESYFVRCAVVYNVEVKNSLKTERVFIYFAIALFFIVGGLLYLVTNRLGQLVNKLRDFAIRAGRNESIDPNLELSDSEFGDIQNQIIQIYGRLKSAKDELTVEKDRLHNHLLALNEGIALFNSEKEKIFANSNFIQYINMISNRSSISAERFFKIGEVQKLIQKIDGKLSPDVVIPAKDLPNFEITVSKNEKFFRVQSIIFMDKSFEILIRDITKPEKRRMLKQQLTSNIAHELKTPLASVKGYLETIINNKELKREKTVYFAKRAYAQSERLSDLLNDVSLLNNIEDAGDLFEFTPVRLGDLARDVIENLDSRLKENNVSVDLAIDSKVKILGNDSLLSSIFQNLIENSINYAGNDIEIKIHQYLEDDTYYYFNYSDTGTGIPEDHLHRIFERFYRVDEGRSRDSGGTGLGLSIVKNAVQLHKGEISVRNRLEGGLEFLFSLAK